MPSHFKSTSFDVLRADFLLTLRLALPLIVAEVGWMSMGIVDTIMVGRLPDSAVAIGATGLGQSLYHSVAIFGGGLLLGLDTFVAQAYGREDLKDACHSVLGGIETRPRATGVGGLDPDRLASSMGIAQTGNTGGDTNPDGNRGVWSSHRVRGETRGGAFVGSRDCLKLRGPNLHGSF